MTLVENDQTDIIDQGWVTSQGEVELLGSGDDDVPLSQQILVGAAGPDRAVEGCDGFPQRGEGALQGRFGLG